MVTTQQLVSGVPRVTELGRMIEDWNPLLLRAEYRAVVRKIVLAVGPFRKWTLLDGVTGSVIKTQLL